jgi:ankyrin repeat protein
LDQYAGQPEKQKFKGDNGNIDFERSIYQQAFEKAVDKNDVMKAGQLLELHQEFAKDETYFWGEGILMMPAKENHREMMELLIRHGARIPPIIKWAQFYYFERLDASVFLMEKGMSANIKSWQEVTILHDMAQKGQIEKAELLIKYGAAINAVDEAYKSTPLAVAVRWGQKEMVRYLLSKGADPKRAGAPWATPLSWAKNKNQEDIYEMLINAGAV